MLLPRSILFFISLALTSPSQAQSLCRDLFMAAPELGQLKPVEQLLYWEQTSNLPQMRETTQPVWIDLAIAPPHQVQTVSISSQGSQIIQYFKKPSGFFWPKHPLNTDLTVPFANKERIGLLKSFASASRSFFFYIGGGLYSVKLPTNRTHEQAPLEPGKTDMTLTQLLLNRSKAIQSRDEVLPESTYVRVLNDVASLIDKKTNSGFLVRDLTPLQDGNYYLPAFAIPYVGAAIAKRAGVSFEAFWGEHYAHAVGRAKAELLLRYGLVMTSPHPQNLLIQLDAQFFPTGKIFIRDIADSVYVEQVANTLGLRDAVREDLANDRSVSSYTDINSQNTFSRLDEAGLDQNLLKRWESQHDQAYIDHMVKELELDPQKYNTFYAVVSLFSTDLGISQLKAYEAARGN